MTAGRTALVTDGDQRSALAVVRSLGQAGWRCVVVSDRDRSLAGASRFARAQRRAPDALREPRAFALALAALAHAEDASLVVPIAEPAMLAVLAERERFPAGSLPWPGLEAFRAICDKEGLLTAAARLGIAVPAQRVLTTLVDLDRVLDAGIDYPVVLKPARSVGEHEGERRKLGVSYASDERELRAAVAGLPPAAFPLLLQQRIVGPGVGVFLLLWEGEVRAAFAHRRLREKPPSGGVSVYRESIVMDHDLAARSRALLEQFGWRGVAMIEYKRDAGTGIPYLMEINGRFWGSLQLAIDAGVDFPRLLAECASGTAPAAPPAYRPGVRSRWWWGEVDHVLTRLRGRRRALLPPDTPSLPRTLLDMAVAPLRRHDREEIWRLDDPQPFLQETRQWLRTL